MYNSLVSGTTAQSVSIAVINADVNRLTTVTVEGFGSGGLFRSGVDSQFGMSSFTLTPTIDLTDITTLSISIDVNYP
jgi:hypothetical protein